MAITGSFGKTTTARALKTVLFQATDPQINNNAILYAALTILQLRPTARYAVIETGINGPV